MFMQLTNQWHNSRFETEGKHSWRRPTGLCREPTNQHSENKLDKWWWIRIWLAVLKLYINGKCSAKRKRWPLTKLQTLQGPRRSLIWPNVPIT